MAVSPLTPTAPRPIAGDVDAGVIEDARARQRRHRMAALTLLLAAIGAAGLLLGAAGGGHGGGSSGHSSHGPSGAGSPANVGHLSNAPSAAAVAAATASCNWLIRSNGPPTLAGKPVLIDGRGSYVAEIYVNGRVVRTCISNGQHTATSISTDNRTLGFEPAPGPNQLGSPSEARARAPGFSSANQEGNVQGRAGSTISTVAFEFADGSAVNATVQDGWYFAWWPEDAWPTSVTTTAGTAKTTSPMGVKACHAEAAGCVFAEPHPSDG